MFDTTPLKGVRVNTAFPVDSQGTIDPEARYGVVTGKGGPWQVAVRWDDGTTDTIHVEDVIFE